MVMGRTNAAANAPIGPRACATGHTPDRHVAHGGQRRAMRRRPRPPTTTSTPLTPFLARGVCNNAAATPPRHTEAWNKDADADTAATPDVRQGRA